MCHLLLMKRRASKLLQPLQRILCKRHKAAQLAIRSMCSLFVIPQRQFRRKRQPLIQRLSPPRLHPFKLHPPLGKVLLRTQRALSVLNKSFLLLPLSLLQRLPLPQKRDYQGPSKNCTAQLRRSRRITSNLLPKIQSFCSLEMNSKNLSQTRQQPTISDVPPKYLET